MKAKVWIWSCVVLGTAGVGVPTAWRNVTRQAPPEPPDLPAESESGVELVFAPSFDPVPAQSPAAIPATPGAASPADGPAGSTLEASLSRLERMLPRRSDGTLDRLARGETSGLEAALGSVAATADAADPLARFLAENPLCGVLAAPDGAVALLGRRAVHEGETFLDGRARLLAVEARGARIEIDGIVRLLELPALSACPSDGALQVGLDTSDAQAGLAGEMPR